MKADGEGPRGLQKNSAKEITESSVNHPQFI